VETPPVWGPRATARIAAARAAGDRFAVTDLVRMECLVGPLRAGDAARQAGFVAFFAMPDVDVLPLTAAVCDRAAHIRAATRFRPLDALHLAAAVENGCDLFLTKDAGLSAFPGIPIEILP